MSTMKYVNGGLAIEQLPTYGQELRQAKRSCWIVFYRKSRTSSPYKIYVFSGCKCEPGCTWHAQEAYAKVLATEVAKSCNLALRTAGVYDSRQGPYFFVEQGATS